MQKILLEITTVTKVRSFTKGNLEYELTLPHYSSITTLGEPNIFKNLKPTKINFEDIPEKKGFISIFIITKFINIILHLNGFLNDLLIEIVGFLRNSFVIKNKLNENELFGSITDGQYKLDVLLTKNDSEIVNIERGTKVEVIGDLQESGNYMYKKNYF